MATVKSAAQIAQAWQQGMASPQAQQNYTNGVNAVTTAPNAKAAQASAQYLAGVNQSVSSGKYAANNNAVSLAAWKSAAVAKASRLASGAQAGAGNYQAAMQQWQPIYQQVSDAVQAMPKGGLANAISRSQTAIQMMMQAAGKA